MRDHPNAIMLFAAGFGTRMRELTKHQPKPLVRVANRTLLDHALEQVNQYTPLKKVVNCHYFPEQVKAHLSNQKDITIVEERDIILETGGGLKNAINLKQLTLKILLFIFFILFICSRINSQTSCT